MAGRKSKLLHPGMRELLNDPAIAKDLEARAQAVLAAARSAAPVATGAYRDSLHVDIVHTDRVVARVVAGTDHALLVESKTGNLAKALNAAGGAA